jgi:hypothetical protein
MQPSRLLHSLLALIFAVIALNIASPAAACCGEAPYWFFTAFVENQPLCSNRDGSGGSVTWNADYHLFSGASSHMSVLAFGDDVIQEVKWYALPHQPGEAVDTIGMTTTWKWKVNPLNNGATRTAKVQLDVGSANDFRDGAVIVITCSSRGLESWKIENVEGFHHDY